jgi:calcium/calmodulin-dependent protein kinase I
LLPEIKAYLAKARLRRGIEKVKLSNRIAALKAQEDAAGNEDSDLVDPSLPSVSGSASASAAAGSSQSGNGVGQGKASSNLGKAAKASIFREVVMAKVREAKEQEQTLKVQEEAEKEAKRRSLQGP